MAEATLVGEALLVLLLVAVTTDTSSSELVFSDEQLSPLLQPLLEVRSLSLLSCGGGGGGTRPKIPAGGGGDVILAGCELVPLTVTA